MRILGKSRMKIWNKSFSNFIKSQEQALRTKMIKKHLYKVDTES